MDSSQSLLQWKITDNLGIILCMFLNLGLRFFMTTTICLHNLDKIQIIVVL